MLLPTLLVLVAFQAPALEARIDAIAEPLIESRSLVGACVGLLDGEETFVRGYGVMAPGGDKTPDGDTVYEIGSITKVFTGLLLALAVERGEATLEDPVQDHLPDGVTLADWSEDERILLWHLSTHTSGLPRMPANFAPADPKNPYADYDEARLFAGLAQLQPADVPGHRYEYSNLAVGLLGTLLVRAADAPSYEALLRERICIPLGLDDTVVSLDEDHRARLAPPHDVDGRPEHNWDLTGLAGAGAIRSTVNDLLRFAAVQMDAASSPLAKAIERSHVVRHREDNGGGVALGWHVAPSGVIWHNGQTGGYHSYFACDIERRQAVVVLSNTATGMVDALGNALLRTLRGDAVEPPKVRAAIPLGVDVLARYAGTYQLNPLFKFNLSVEGDQLLAQLTGQPAFVIHPLSTTRFFYRVVDAEITFELDDHGEPKALVLHQNGMDQRAEKVR